MKTCMAKGEEPIAFDHDCREGICGTCSLTINGVAHGPSETTTCQLYMRKFKDGETIYIEPFRARAVSRRARPHRRSQRVRPHPAGRRFHHRAHRLARRMATPCPIAKPEADRAMEAAACIGCGACVAACPNASAMLFVGAKVSHLALAAAGPAGAHARVLRMVRTMDEEGFGNCSNYYECEAVCPAEIPISVMTRLNREYAGSAVRDSLT